jgi:hypothetical protein
VNPNTLEEEEEELDALKEYMDRWGCRWSRFSFVIRSKPYGNHGTSGAYLERSDPELYKPPWALLTQKSRDFVAPL